MQNVLFKYLKNLVVYKDHKYCKAQKLAMAENRSIKKMKMAVFKSLKSVCAKMR